jgi:hypothetical protein
MAHLIGRQIKSPADKDFEKTTDDERKLLDENGCYTGTILEFTRARFKWRINNCQECTYWQPFEWIVERLVLQDGECRKDVPRKPPAGFVPPAKKSAASAAQKGPFIAPPPQFFGGTAPSKETLDSFTYNELPATEKTTHGTPTKKKQRTGRDDWSSGARVFKPKGAIKEKACGGKRDCRYDCSNMTMAHKTMIREQLKVVFEQKGAIGGVKGIRSFVEKLTRPAPIDEVALAKKGWLPKAIGKVAGMRCLYCKELPQRTWGEDHIWGERCANHAVGVACFSQRKATYLAEKRIVHLEYNLPGPTSFSRPFRVCCQTFNNVLGLGNTLSQ